MTMLDVEALLVPIRPGEPCGSDLRELQTRTRLHEARDLRKESRGSDEPGKSAPTQWKRIAELCRDGLCLDSKDLELAAYLTEAEMRTHGLAGLLSGLQLLGGLVEHHWDGLHPHRSAGEEMPELRLKHLSWLAHEGKDRRGEFLLSLATVPLTAPVQVGEVTRRLTLHDHLGAEMLEEAQRLAPSRHAEMLSNGKVTLAEWRAAVAATPEPARAEAAATLRRCLEALARLEALLGERCGAQAPSLATLARALERMNAALGGAPAGGPQSPTHGGSAESVEPADPHHAAPQALTAQTLAGRRDAARQLKQIAGFLRATEPHSPVSYLIERAVKWLDMPFESLVREFIKEPAAMNHLRETLGIPSAQEADNR